MYGLFFVYSLIYSTSVTRFLHQQMIQRFSGNESYAGSIRYIIKQQRLELSVAACRSVEGYTKEEIREPMDLFHVVLRLFNNLLNVRNKM